MEDIIEYLGYVAALFISIRIAKCTINFIRKNILSSPLNVKDLGEWALVTGSTDGIGKAYAMALAQRGMNIILISRTRYKLQNVAAEIETKYKVSTVIIDVDFTADAASYIPRLTTELEDYSIGVLVNNVGMSLEHPMPFLDIEEATLKKLVDVNITSMNAMTRFILPQMVERRKGAIINIGSMSSRIPNPMYSVYAGAKAYVEKFSDCIQKEYGSKGITIQCVTPGYVVSNMSKIKRSSWLAPTPEAFVKSALNKLGTHPLTTGYFSHEVMLNFINCLPGPLANKLVWDQLSAIRQKALRKKNKEQ